MNMGNMMNKMFGQIAPGLCRLSMNGGIAINTGPGEYKTYNLKTGRLTNCSNFVFNIGEEWFFVIPTNKVVIGDIILVNGEPRCVVAIGDGDITVINYKTSVKETILPERHVFMGNTYFYGKIVSMFGNGTKGKSKKSIFKYMMMMSMFQGNNPMGSMMGDGSVNTGAQNNPMAAFAMMSAFGGGMGDMFDGMFDFDLDDDDEDEEDFGDEVPSTSKKTKPVAEEEE